jgi:hypothetical protein
VTQLDDCCRLRGDHRGMRSILRFGAAFCFIGHGAFGFLRKESWLAYFAIFGIPADWAPQIMPVIGAVDVVAGVAVLFAPSRLALGYMVVWAAWTALLRPLAGESIFEAVERAGNYGVPLALVLLLSRPSIDVSRVLQWTTVLLLGGHGALGILHKPLLIAHYSAIGLPSSTTAIVGWFEVIVAIFIAVRPTVSLLIFAAFWKAGTESLFLIAGDPIWEVVERAGSYAAPLALAALIYNRDGLRSHAETRRAPIPGGDHISRKDAGEVRFIEGLSSSCGTADTSKAKV